MRSSSRRKRRNGRGAGALAALLTALGLLVAACAAPVAEKNVDGGHTYTIGTLAPETGSQAQDGPVVREGVQLALADIERSGILGKDKLRAAYADNQAAPDVTVSAFNQMVSLKGPIASVTTFSGPTLAITPIATRTHVTLLNPGGVTPNLGGASPYLFNLIPLIDTQASIMMHYVAEKKVAHRVALMYSNDALGQGMQETFAKRVRKAGLEYAGAVAFDPTSPDFRAALSKLQSMHPDAVYETGTASQSGNIIKQGTAIGFTPRWLGYSAFGHQDSIDVGGKAAQKSLFTIPATTNQATGKPYAEYARFIHEFEKKNGAKHPDYLTQTTYEAVQMVAAAIAETKRHDQPVTRENVQRQIKSLRGFPSIYGPTSVRKDGSLVQSQVVQTVNGKHFVNRRIYSATEIAKLG